MNNMTVSLLKLFGTLVQARNNIHFPALNPSNKFNAIDYGAHLNTKTDLSIDYFYKTIPVAESNTLNTICEYL